MRAGSDVTGWVVLAAVVAACSTPSGSSDAGGGATTDASVDVDAGAADAGGNVFVEVEPNDGAAATDVNAITLPASGTGAIDPADDMDILSVTLAAGTSVSWTLQAGTSSGFAPHLGITEDGDRVPHLVAVGGAGGTTTQEQFVLEGARYYVFVRDARNVPAASSQHLGGAAHAWRLQAAVTPRTHVPATFPSTVNGTLRSRHAQDTYAFHADTAFAFDLVVDAARKTPASDMDSRMSLFHATTGTHVMTNDDDVASGTSDSHVGGTLPAAGDYVVVVDNVDAAATDLTYTLRFSLR